MSLDVHKAAVRGYVEAFNAHDMARMALLFTDDAQIWGVMGAGGLDVVEPIWRDLHHCLEMKLEILDLAAEGDQVAARYRETGRFVHPFRGMPGVEPTGRSYEIVAMEWFRFRDSRIVARWGARDSATIYGQLTGG